MLHVIRENPSESAPIVPRRFRIPLIREIDPEGGLTDVRLEGQARATSDLLGQGAADRVGDVDLTTLQARQARGLVGNRSQDEALHVRRLAPVLLEGVDDELDTRGERDEPVWTGADRRFLEPFVADLLDVFLRHDPAGAGGADVESQEVGPRPLEAKAHASGVRRLDRRHTVLQRLGGGAAVTLERELHILGGDRVAAVKPGGLSDHELVDEPVGRHAPRLGEARRHGAARQRLQHRVVQGVEHHVGRDDPGRLGRIEPCGGERDVNGPDHLAGGRFRAPRGGVRCRVAR